MAFEVEEQFKRMDYIHDIESASVSGFIKGFADSYRTELANNGLDKSTVRQKAIGGLCQLGFEKNEVNEIIRLEPGEWDTIAQMYPVDMEWRKTYCDKIYKSALDGCNKFERKHPGYFNIIKYNIGGRHNKKTLNQDVALIWFSGKSLYQLSFER